MPYAVLRLVVFVAAMIVIPTLVWRRVGGKFVSHAGLLLGVAVLAVGEVLQLAAAVYPGWSAAVATIGGQFPIHASGFILLFVGFMSLMQDMKEVQERDRQATRDERSRAETARLHEAKLRAVLDGATDYCIITCDTHGRVTSYSTGGARVLGWDIGDVVDKRTVGELLSPRHPLSQDDVFGAVAEHGRFEAEVLMGRKDGHEVPMLLTVTPLTDAQGRPEGYIGVAKDITDMRAAREALARMAATDYLTGLANRRQAELIFDHEIARSCRHQTPLAVIMMDLDRFKSVNDTYGHDVGDVCLKHVAEHLRQRLRASDIVARHGGEEFLLVLPETGLEDATALADAIRCRIVQDEVVHGDLRIRLAISAGVAVLEPGQGISAGELVRRADQAMYDAKGLGGNRVVTWQEPREAKVEVGLVEPR